ncbi:hypothetical protein [Poseidonibacter lekithochrous]|uniref:hypothetical protein n=1 Tax=Poseidonibacter lekithochrous TaxID=1904463 RepID=UPI0008FC35E7|nr:hypothetical protein [Poseidonibacter lekithochrous]QKJ22312.1 hypothetical protein ALEK_1032 [Poseidonibacter lekithochrous]
MKELEFCKKGNNFIKFLSVISLLTAILMSIWGLGYPIISELFFDKEVEFDCVIEYIAVIAILTVFFVNNMRYKINR